MTLRFIRAEYVDIFVVFTTLACLIQFTHLSMGADRINVFFPLFHMWLAVCCMYVSATLTRTIAGIIIRTDNIGLFVEMLTTYACTLAFQSIFAQRPSKIFLSFHQKFASIFISTRHIIVQGNTILTNAIPYTNQPLNRNHYRNHTHCIHNHVRDCTQDNINMIDHQHNCNNHNSNIKKIHC